MTHPSRRVPNRPRSAVAGLVALVVALGVAGCGYQEVETTYGRSRGQSINGTNAFAELIRERGHSTRVALRYTATLGEWAAAIVRFAPGAGPPDPAEATWLRDWLDADPGRRLIYVVKDHTTDAEFWARMLAVLPADARRSDRDKIQEHLTAARTPPPVTPPDPAPTTQDREWFATELADPKQPNNVAVAKHLDGPWAEGVDGAAAALPVHRSIRTNEDDVALLTGDGRDLVTTLEFRQESAAGGNVLVVANGAFLLNGGLINQARRPLATRAVDWLGDAPIHVAFVEGSFVMSDGDDAGPSPFHLLAVSPFNWVTAQLGAFGILLCLALAVRIGRPRPEPGTSVERPSAHPIALGALLARTRQVAVAQDLLATYRRWREPTATPHRTESATPSPRRVPRA